MKLLLEVPECLYLQPLLFGLDHGDSPFELKVAYPAQTALDMQQRTGDVQCAVLSPVDYARHGAEYRIVPGIGVSSSGTTNTIQLLIKEQTRNIATIASDIRVTSEVVLAVIILRERYHNISQGGEAVKIIPMMPDVEAMLAKADAALVVNFAPGVSAPAGTFPLDLVEEWHDMTGLPYVHAFWVGREDQVIQRHIAGLARAMHDGVAHLHEVASRAAALRGIDPSVAESYLSSFRYGFGDEERESVAEFVRYAFYYGMLRDVPELRFFSDETPPGVSLN